MPESRKDSVLLLFGLTFIGATAWLAWSERAKLKEIAVDALNNPLIATARAELERRVREVGGTNRGTDVEKYQKTVGLRAGDPWCAAFVAWVVTAALGRERAPAWCSGSAVTQWQRASKRLSPAHFALPHETHKVQPGWVWVRARNLEDAALARKGQWTTGHTGLVEAVGSADFRTIEGNTNSAGSREGDGVYGKTQRWDDGRTLGFFDPIALTKAYETGNA